jgi:hypothetical protein
MDEESDSWIPPSAQPYAAPPIEDEAQTCLKRKNATTETAATRLIKQPKVGETISSKSQIERSSQETKQPPRVRRLIRLQRNGAALPGRIIFDPWNANSNGHQQAENKLSGSVAWRESKERKLAKQFEAGRGGGIRVADSVGPGAPNGKKNRGWIESVGHERESGQKTIEECFGGAAQSKRAIIGYQSNLFPSKMTTQNPNPGSPKHQSPELCGHSTPPCTKLFANTVIYINGSTQPFVSDHALRHIIVKNGGTMSTALLRKRVTHVIVTAKVTAPSTDPDAPPSTLAAHLQGQNRDAALRKVSAGGGLAAGKIQREIERAASKAAAKVKYVTANWVLDSIEAGRRLSERAYMDWRFVEAGQETVNKYFDCGEGSD